MLRGGGRNSDLEEHGPVRVCRLDGTETVRLDLGESGSLRGGGSNSRAIENDSELGGDVQDEDEQEEATIQVFTL